MSGSFESHNDGDPWQESATPGNPYAWEKLSMTRINLITLQEVSPFKVSAEQTTSLDAFIKVPWPTKGTIAYAFRDGDKEDFVSVFLSEPVNIGMAEGLMKVMGTWSAAVKFKLSEVLLQGAGKINSLQPNWDGSSNIALSQYIDEQAAHLQEWLIGEIIVAHSKRPDAAQQEGLTTAADREALKNFYQQAYLQSTLRLGRTNPATVACVRDRSHSETTLGDEPSSLRPSSLTSNGSFAGTRSWFSAVPGKMSKAIAKTRVVLKSNDRVRQRFSMEADIMNRKEIIEALQQLQLDQSVTSETTSQNTLGEPRTVLKCAGTEAEQGGPAESFVETTSDDEEAQKQRGCRSIPSSPSATSVMVPLTHAGKTHSWDDNPNGW